MSRMQAGHQRAATGSAHGIAAVELGEAHAVAGQAVDVRCANDSLPITAQLAPT